MIGQKLEVRHPDLKPGSQFHYRRRDWNIAGVFSDNERARESEIWTDIEDLRADAQAHNKNTNSLHLVLKPGSGAALAQALKNDTVLLLCEAGLIGSSGAAIGAAGALWYFRGGMTLGAITGAISYMEVRPPTAIAAVAVALAVSLISTAVPLANAARVAPALGIRKVI